MTGDDPDALGRELAAKLKSDLMGLTCSSG